MSEEDECCGGSSTCCAHNNDASACTECAYFNEGKCELTGETIITSAAQEYEAAANEENEQTQTLLPGKKELLVETNTTDQMVVTIKQDSINDEIAASKDSFFARFVQFIKFCGPAVLISVGYVDPGNWATDIAGGSNYQYKLLWVLVVSNMLGIVLQSLSAKIGLVTGKDLAQQCANFYPKSINFILWILAELAIASTDLAEVLGTAIGLNLLFKLPLIWGVLLTAGDTLLFLVFQQLGHRFMEFFIFVLMAIISVCFVIEMFFSKPSFVGIMDGLIPRIPAGSLMTAAGIVGSVIMPHNLFLHSGLVLTRRTETITKTKRYLTYSIIDSVLSLNLALFVNAAILIVSAATFYNRQDKPELIQEAYMMLERIFGSFAAILFGIGLLAAGQSSTITGTLAGQMVMEGFVNWKMVPWLRRFLTRALAIVPAVIVIWATGDDGSNLLLWSQVVLSIQLPFTMIPLVRITGHKDMGIFQNAWYTQIFSWLSSLGVVALNLWLVVDALREQFGDKYGIYMWIVLVTAAVVFVGMVALVSFYPIKPKQKWPFSGAMDPLDVETRAKKNPSMNTSIEDEPSQVGTVGYQQN